MKLVLLTLILLIVASCSTIDQAEKNLIIDNQITDNIEKKTPQIDWLGKDIMFSHCAYWNKEDPNITKLESIIQKHPEIWWQESGMHFWQFVWEYCTDWVWRYIFYADYKAPISFGRYDTKLDIFEWAWYNTYFTTNISQFAKQSGTGFWKRVWNSIEFSQKNISYYPYTMKDFTFQKKENMEYCSQSYELSHGRGGACNYDAYYRYDFTNTNSVTLEKLCIFYTENNERKVLESCRYNPSDERSRAQDKNNVKILYVGVNSLSDAEYYISIDCIKDDTSHSQIGLIPDDADIEIYIWQACNTTRINPKVLDLLIHKKFKSVAWFREVFPETPLYKFTTGEIEKIARANWQYLDIEELKTEQYKLIRNTKNLYRKWLRSLYDNQFYTKIEKEKCSKYLDDLAGIENPPDWEWAVQKSEECYRNLPPIP